MIFVGRQWMYQTCTEFGFYQTSTAKPNLFSDTFPVKFFIQQCIDIFGPRFVSLFKLYFEYNSHKKMLKQKKIISLADMI